MRTKIFAGARKELALAVLAAAGSTVLTACPSNTATYKPAPNYPATTQPYTGQPSTGQPVYTPPATTTTPPPAPPAGKQMACGGGKCG